ncbi:MAG TPA: MFS transporter [Candidatus Polarisedimenticolaceae bacterium]|nr:MFS transporter [Candidatus Polarisedimenticolaceae bacterium]
MRTQRSELARHLALATLSFAVCFMAWGLVGALAPRFRTQFALSATATGLLVATPVLLGAVARLPVGLLADRFGGRGVFAALMLVVAGAAAIVPRASSYGQLLAAAFLLGLAGAAFPVGVGYVSRWAPPARQGSALGIYGAGNIGQSLAVFGAPLVAAAWSVAAVFHVASALLVVWAGVFAFLARDAPATVRPAGLGALIRVLTKEPGAWLLGLFYFLTFGGFVAFSIYLPTLLQDEFGLSAGDAGLRAAGFVVLATAMRPVGGWLADRIGGGRVLSGVLRGIVPFALLMTWPAIVPFTVGALGCASLLGLGNGAVFKLVPQHFPQNTGTVGGLVGALGGLGGFFPPLVLGFFRDHVGASWPGFVLLAAVAALLSWAGRRSFVSQEEREARTLAPAALQSIDRARAAAWASFWTAVLAATIVVGSRNLQQFDAALVVYTFAIIFATWGTVYHYWVWIQRPPTQIYWRRGWELTRRRGVLRSLLTLVPLVWSHLFAQSFIRQRSALRWWMHQTIFWGCLLAVAITFPLVFGWIHFESAPDDAMTYVTYLFGFPTASFRVRTLVSWLLFHGLDIAAVLVLSGVALALRRRMLDRGARALQDFARDFFPLVLLSAIAITGLALTASTLWFRGALYGFLSLLHAVVVVAGLLYLPFGKFFHVFQRPAQLGVKLYQRAGEEGESAACARCGAPFASRLHVGDLQLALQRLGFDYRIDGPAATWQGVCPPCKRKALALAQLRIKEPARG